MSKIIFAQVIARQACLHVGHYVGSLKERVRLQNSGLYDEVYIMIADAQALTDNAEHPEKFVRTLFR